MPTTLSNGVLVYNATPHELTFEMQDGSIEQVGIDVVISCRPVVTPQERNELYEISSVVFLPNEEGESLIAWVKREYPGVVIVGSIIAAQAYPGEVVTAVPWRGGKQRRSYKSKVVRPDRFTVYPKKEEYNG